MTWVAWRVQRLQFLVAAGVVVALVLWLVASGLDGHSGWSQYWNSADVYVLYALPGLLGLAFGSSLIVRSSGSNTIPTARRSSPSSSMRMASRPTSSRRSVFPLATRWFPARRLT